MNDLQRTPEWVAARLGKLTGSRIAPATAKVKSGDYAAGRENIIADLAVERTTGISSDFANWKSQPMQDGIDRESDGIITYEFERNVTVDLVGFIDHPRIAMAGCSPDGLVGGPEKTGHAVSLKCPLPATHLKTLKGASIDGGYIKQLQWELGVTGREYCDFVSYCPLFKSRAQIKIIRVTRDDKMIATLDREAAEILAKVEEAVELLRKIENGIEDNTTLEQLKASVEALSA